MTKIETREQLVEMVAEQASSAILITERFDQAERILNALQAAGLAVVPLEATKEMRNAANNAQEDASVIDLEKCAITSYKNNNDELIHIVRLDTTYWKAMLSTGNLLNSVKGEK